MHLLILVQWVLGVDVPCSWRGGDSVRGSPGSHHSLVCLVSYGSQLILCVVNEDLYI